MKIGIDIDDTTILLVNSMIKYADIFDTKILGRKGSNGNLGLIKNRYYLEALYGWDKITKFNFFDMYYKNVLEEGVPLPNVSQIINKLKEEGHEISFIKARLTNIKNCETEKITLQTLKNNNIPYDKVIFDAFDKLKFCKENGIEIFIEDSYETCKELEENNPISKAIQGFTNKSSDENTLKKKMFRNLLIIAAVAILIVVALYIFTSFGGNKTYSEVEDIMINAATKYYQANTSSLPNSGRSLI